MVVARMVKGPARPGSRKLRGWFWTGPLLVPGSTRKGCLRTQIRINVYLIPRVLHALSAVNLAQRS